MILVDTPVWVDHFRKADAALDELLDANQVLLHPHVTGELAMGSLKDRDRTLFTLQDQPQAAIAEDDEVVRFVTQHRLYALGLSYTDAHLLASALITPGAKLWTRDKALRRVAEKLGIAAPGLN